jgi:hypothetical protein
VCKPATLFLCACVLLGLTGCDGMSAGELKRSTENVGSNAAEGALLAEQIAKQDVQHPFVRVHAGELADAEDHIVAKLAETQEEHGLPAELQGPARATSGLASDASDALQELELHPEDPAQAAVAEKKLRHVSDKADQVASGL